METILLRELLEAVHGTLLTQDVPMDTPIYRVETDSRTIHPGALFIPLVGERFDGHAYLNQALEDGAAGCLTARSRDSYIPGKFYIKVGNTERALGDLAAWYKGRFRIPVVGVTGSVGKTTTKDMIAAVLSTKYKVLKTEGNFNNNVGMPMTILRLDPAASETLGEARVALVYEGADFSVTAMDDAMSGDRILERDTVFVRRCTAFEGEGIYAVRLGGVTMLRRVTVDGGSGNMVFWASNPAFPPTVITAAQEPPELLGRAFLLQTAL